MKINKLIKENLLLILIFLVAALVRTWDIPNSLIFFDDAGRDMMVAQHSLENKSIPLLGIPSSVPRFRQGPVTIWFEMVILGLFGHNLTMVALGFIVLSLLAMVIVYEFSDRFLGKRISVIATYLMALSPMAIAQARMPYHTSPIPLATSLYLFALVRLFQKKPHALFWAVLAWSFLFQFELAIFPTILVIPWILYRTKKLKFSFAKAQEVTLAVVIGLLPQIIHDLRNNFSQLGLFVVWIGYRLLGLFGGEHSFSFAKVVNTLNSFGLYGGRFFSPDKLIVTLLCFSLIGWAIWKLVGQWKSKKIEPAMEVVLAFFAILTLGYFLHGSPSEAYFPPLIVVFPILTAYALNQLFKKKSALLMVLLVAWGLMNFRSILDHRFFVSNSQPFSYGCSVKNQKQIIDFISDQAPGSYRLDTTRDIRKFDATFDNLRWLSYEYGYRESSTAKNYFYIEDSNSPLRFEPDIRVRHFGCADLYFYE